MRTEPELLFEAAELGPIALHDGVLFSLEADPDIAPKHPFKELFTPTPRWALVARELATGRSRRVVEELLPLPHFIVADDAGFALLGNDLRLFDANGHATHTIPFDTRRECEFGWSRETLVFGHSPGGHERLLCSADRQSGEIRREIVQLDGQLGVVGSDGSTLAWTHDMGRTLFVAPFTDLSSVREIEIGDRIQHVWVCGDAIAVGTPTKLLTVRGDQATALEGWERVSHLWMRSPTWFGAVRGITHVHAEEERHSGGVVRVRDEVELIYSSEPTGHPGALGMGVENSIYGVTADETRVVFLERSGSGPCRVWSLPVDAPIVDRHVAFFDRDD